MYIRTSSFVSFENYYIGLLANNATWCQNRGYICISSTRRTYSRIHAISCITSSHPDNYKNNNSVNRIISKEKEREDPRRDSSKTSFQLESKSIQLKNPRRDSSFYTQSSSNYKLILHTELILQEIQELQGSFCAGIFQQLLPVYPSILHGRTRLQAPSSNSRPYSTSRLPVILPGRNSILHGSQHTRSPSSNSQAQST